MAKNVFVLGLAPFFSCNFVDDVANPKPNILVNIVPVSHSVLQMKAFHGALRISAWPLIAILEL